MIPFPWPFLCIIIMVSCPYYNHYVFLSSFTGQDMQALINKINKSIVSPLPAMYSGGL